MKNITAILLSVGTACASFIGGYYLAKRKYEKRIDDLEAYYSAMENYDPNDSGLQELKKSLVEEDAQKEESTRAEGEMSQEKRDEIREKLQRNYEVTTDYASMYIEKEEKRPEEDPLEEEGREMTDQYAQNKTKPPEFLDLEQLQDLPDYIQTQPLEYYLYSETVVDDDGNVIPDPVDILGPAFMDFDPDKWDGDAFGVVNWELGICYIIQMVNMAFEGED